MTFDEPRISSINYLNPEAVYALMIQDLCGEKYHRQFNETDRGHLADFLGLAIQ
jgi:hypothetical protein